MCSPLFHSLPGSVAAWQRTVLVHAPVPFTPLAHDTVPGVHGVIATPLRRSPLRRSPLVLTEITNACGGEAGRPATSPQRRHR